MTNDKESEWAVGVVGGHQLHGGGVYQGNKTQINLPCLPGAVASGFNGQPAPLFYCPNQFGNVELFFSVYFESIAPEEAAAGEEPFDMNNNNISITSVGGERMAPGQQLLASVDPEIYFLLP